MRILSAIRPSSSQKRVMAKIVASPTPKVAGEQTSGDANMVQARNMLVKLGVVAFNNGEASLTTNGLQIAADENIIDSTGQLTDAGQALAYSNTQGTPDTDLPSQQQPAISVQGAAQSSQVPQQATAESASLIKELFSR